MGTLKLLWILPFLHGTATAQPSWRPAVEEASVRFAIPAGWIERVIMAESGGRTRVNGRPIVSRKGAMGLMQLMPATWGEMRWRLGLGSDPHKPRDNILAGTFYLRLMYDRFGYPGLFAAYNAGPSRYASHLAGRSSLPRETHAYLVATAGFRASGSRGASARKSGSSLARGGGLFFIRIPAAAVRADKPDLPS